MKAIIHGEKREILGTYLNDAEVASCVYMYTTSNVNPRSILLREKELSEGEKVSFALPEIARDRILALSQRLERAEALLKQYNETSVNYNLKYYFKYLDADAIKFLQEPKTVPSSEPDVMKRA